jgi:alpha-glucosidase
VDRAATRFGSGGIGVERGVARARAAALVQFSLPGAVYVYNGDELGLANVELPDWALQDPSWERSGHTERGRDGERVPLPWDGDEPPFGFSTGESSWLPMPPEWKSVTVAAQEDDPDSTLHLYRRALALRHSDSDLLTGLFGWVDDADDDVLAYRRGSIHVVVNTGDEAVRLPPGEVLLASAPVSEGSLPADAAVWVRR